MTLHSPIPDFAAARRAMVEGQLRPQGVADAAVLQAMGSVKREDFLPSHTRPLAYVDRSVAVGPGRFLSPPAVVGQLLTQMKAEPGQRALVIGAATGYSVAVLIAMGLDVTGVESDPALAARGAELGLPIIQGSLEAGHRKRAPYDQILIDGAVEVMPDAIVAQLADGGRLGTALIEGGIARLIIGRKAGTAFGYLSIGDAAAPALPGFARAQAFTF